MLQTDKSSAEVKPETKLSWTGKPSTLPHSNLHRAHLFDNKPIGDEEMKVVAMARGIVDNKLITDAHSEQSVCERLNTRLSDSQHNFVKKAMNRRREAARNVRQEKSSDITFLDGWSTPKLFTEDHDSLHLSNSEFLHPVKNLQSQHEYEKNEAVNGGTHKDTENGENMQRGKQSGSLPHRPVRLKNRSGKLQKTSFSILPTAATTHVKDAEPEIPMVSPTSLKDASKAVKLRLTNVPQEVITPIPKRISAVNEADASFVNVPLSHSASYNIEQNLKSNVNSTSASINMTDKLAMNLKNLSQGVVEEKSKPTASKEDLWKVYNGPVLEVPRQKENITPSLKPQPSDIPDMLSGMQMTIAADEKTVVKPQTIEPLTDFDPWTPRKNIKSRGSNKLIPRQTVDTITRLPPLSVTHLPTKSQTKVNYLFLEKEKKIHHNTHQASKRGSIPCRTRVCNSPFNFDRENPESLRLKTKPLPNMHYVCTECGSISKDTIMSHCAFRKTNENQHSSSLGELYQRSRCNVGCHGTKRYRKQLRPEWEDSHAPIKRMTFDFPLDGACEDIDIKVNLNCNVSVETSEEERAQWLQTMTSPRYRERMECPVSTETRVYRDKLYNPGFASIGADQSFSPLSPVNSPYLDFCKRVAIDQRHETSVPGQHIEGIICDYTSFFSSQKTPILEPAFE